MKNALNASNGKRIWPALVLAILGGLGPAAAQRVVPGGYVQVYPTAATLSQAATQQFRAAVLNPIGFELPNRKVTWKSSKAAVATVDDTGLVTAVAPGTATITASSGAAVGTAVITVNGAPPNSPPAVVITSPADGSTFQQGATITFSGAATDLENGNLSSSIRWTAAAASDPNATQTPLGTGSSVASSTFIPGAYLITAAVTDSGNLSGIAQIGITVTPPCTAVPSFNPFSGTRSPQFLHLDATASYDTCGRQLKYIWDCQSSTTSECPNFNLQANSNNVSNPTPVLLLQEFDTITIVLTVCTRDTNECAPQLIRRYVGGLA